MKEEIWKDVEGYEGRYQVSNLGRIKSLARYIETTSRWGGNFYLLRKERIMKPGKSPNGYRIVTFHTDGKPKHFTVHRVVAMCFLPNPNNLESINHKNGNKEDNSAHNLEWCTHQENVLHAYNSGIRVSVKGSKVNGAKLDEAQVRTIKSINISEVSNSAIGRYFNVSAGAISAIRTGKTWGHLL